MCSVPWKGSAEYAFNYVGLRHVGRMIEGLSVIASSLSCDSRISHGINLASTADNENGLWLDLPLTSSERLYPLDYAWAIFHCHVFHGSVGYAVRIIRGDEMLRIVLMY